MPSTGNHVWAAITPAKCAAPPAPAIITRIPRPAALRAKSVVASGVRCAERTCASLGTRSPSSVSTQWRIISQPDELPIRVATSGEDLAAIDQVVLRNARLVKWFLLAGT